MSDLKGQGVPAVHVFHPQAELSTQSSERIEEVPFACDPAAATTEVSGCATSEGGWDWSINNVCGEI